MADRKPYLGSKAVQTGRTPYLGAKKANVQRTPYLGGSTAKKAAPQKKGGGGFWSTLKHVVTQTPKDLANAAYHAPGGIYTAAKEGVIDPAYNDVRHGPNSKQARNARAKQSTLAVALVKGTVETAKHPLRHPGDTALLFAPAVGRVAKLGEAGALAKGGASAGDVVKAATVGVKPGPRVLKIGDMEVRGHYSRAAGSRVAQKVTDRALEKGATKSLRVENQLHRRAAKWESRNQRTADAVARAPGTTVSALGAKLKPHELRALRLVAEETPVERRLGAQEMRKGRATNAKEQARHQERIDLTKAAMEHLTTDAEGRPAFKPEAKKLQGVYKAIQKASADREGILKNLDLMDEDAAQASKARTAQLVAGGHVVNATTAERQAAHVERAGRRLTRSVLRQAHTERRTALADFYKQRGLQNSAEYKAFRLATTRGGSEKEMAQAERAMLRGLKKHGVSDDSAGALAAAHDLLHQAQASRETDVAGARAAAAQAKTSADQAYARAQKAVTSGAATARQVAEKTTERAAQRRGMAGKVRGAEDIIASPNAVHIGNPVERTKLRGNPKVSSGGTLGHTQKPSSLKVSTGGSVEHALERNDVTNIVAERHQEAVRLGKIDRVVQAYKKAGEPTPRRKDDVWMWTDKVASNERIPKDVREYLDNPDSLAKLSPDAKGSLLDKVKDATFEKHDWEADSEKVAAFEKLAKEGKGVFVPRKLLGEFAKRSYHVGDNPGVKFVDAVNNAQKAGLVYLKLNYPVVQGVSNTAMNIIHQGFAFPRNVTAAIKLESKVGPEYAAITDDIMGQGAVMQAQFEGQGIVARGTQKLAHLMSNKVDQPARRAAFYHEAMKAGYNTPEKYRALLEDDANAGDLAEVAQRARESIVDYGDMGPVERNIVRRIIFVYPWQKGATKYAGHFLRDHPVQAAALAQLGELGKQRSDETFGPVPTYLTGLIPVGGRAANPSGANFFQTPAQGGTAIAGMLNGNPAEQSAGLGFLAPAPGVVAGLLSGHDDIGRPLKGNALAKVRDLTIAQTPAAALARAGLPSSPLVHALLGSQGPSKTFPDANDPFWRFGLGGLYPRKYSKPALNQNAAREKTSR